MAGLIHTGRGLRGLLLPLICLAVLGYLGTHAFVGERGLVTHWRLEEEAMRLERELASVKARRARLEHRVALLSGPRIDADMLDERVRVVLNYARPDELTIMGAR